jgi:hypothetical protein
LHVVVVDIGGSRVHIGSNGGFWDGPVMPTARIQISRHRIVAVVVLIHAI